MYIFGAHPPTKHTPDFETQIKRECVLHLIIYGSTASAGRGRGKMILPVLSLFYSRRSSNGGKMGSNERKTAFTPLFPLFTSPIRAILLPCIRRKKTSARDNKKYFNSVKEREGETEIATFEKAIKPDPNLTKAQGERERRCATKKERAREKKPISSFSSP